jgi:ATPase family associated with various cellular activities (AAA)
MTHYIKRGKTFRLTNKECLDLRGRLPVGTYSVSCDPEGYFLQCMDSFEIKHKLYGDTTRHADRILKTFVERKNTATGVLLTGCKGSGKTLLAKMISMKAAEQDMATIVVNQEFCGEEFNTFMQKINQPVVVLFDEYEKVYKSESQEKLLTLLDGVHTSQKLFLLTCNDKWRVNENMRNRPGRIYYMLDFDGLGPDFIRAYCQDNLVNKEHIEKVVSISGVFRSFNFDLLKGMVEEMNRHNETPAEVLKFLNARPSFDLKHESYKVKIRSADGQVYVGRKDRVGDWGGNPLHDEVLAHYREKVAEKGQHRKTCCERFNAGDLVGMNNDDGSYIFKNKKGVGAVLTPRKAEFSVNFDKIPTTKSKRFKASPAGSDEEEMEELDQAWAMDVTEDESVGDY